MAENILAKLIVQISANAVEFINGLKQGQNSLNQFGQNIKQQTAALNGLQSTLTGLKNIAREVGLTLGATQILRFYGDAINRIAEFERQIDTVSAIAGATGRQLQQLREDALRLGSASQFTATEIAKLQTEFGRLGFTTEEILAATEATIELATATGEDLAKSADVAGSTIRAFGLSAEETGRVVDVMAESFNKTALGLDNFTESMKFVAPVARAANISVEETTALLGVLADSGIRGSNAGTALRRIITDLAKDGRPLQERLKELAAQGLNLSGAMDEVGRFAQTALLVLTNNVDRIEQLTESLNNAAGAAAATAEVMRDNLAGDIEKLTSAWDGLILSMDKSDGTLRQVVQQLTNITEAITDASKENDSLISNWFSFATSGPRFLLGIADMIATWGDEAEISKEKAQELFNELSRIKAIAELEGKAEEAERVGKYIDQLKEKYQGLREINSGADSPNPPAAPVDPRTLVPPGDLEPPLGILEKLNEEAKGFKESMEKATSVERLRHFQHELERVQLRIHSILNPSEPPEPIQIPIEFDIPDLSIDGDEGRRLFDAVQNIIPKDGLVIPIRPEIDPEQLHEEATGEAVKEKLNEIGQAATQNALAINDALASVIDSAISGQQTFAAAMGAVTLDVLQQFQRQALGAALSAYFSSPTPKPFPALLLGAGLAIAAVKALFRRATGVGGGGGGGSASAPEAQRAVRSNDVSRQSIQVEFGTTEFRFNGKELVAAIKQEEFEKGLRG